MSDLAPFVAATLRDKVVAELLEENRRLRFQLESFQRVRITGKNGFPVYVEQDFTAGKPTDHGWWKIRLPVPAHHHNRNHRNNNNHNMTMEEEEEELQSRTTPPTACPMSLLADCEIHVGNFRNMTCRDFNDCFFDGNPKGYFSLCATKGMWLCCYLERVSDHHYQSLCRAAAARHHQYETLPEMLQLHFEEPLEDCNVYFTHLTFCGGSATEAIRNLELLPATQADRGCR